MAPIPPAQPFWSLAQAVSAVAETRRRNPWCVLALGAAWAAVYIGPLWLMRNPRATNVEGLQFLEWFVPTLAGGLSVVAVAAGLRGFWKYPKLNCPQCRADQIRRAELVIASRNCPGCGEQMVQADQCTDQKETFSFSPLDRERLKAELDRYDRHVTRGIVAMILVPVTGALATLGWSTGFDRQRLDDLTTDNPWAGLQAVLPAILVGLITMIAALYARRRWMRQFETTCPNCEFPISSPGQLILATGNCFLCGNAIAPPPLDQVDVQSLPTVLEFQAAGRKFQRAQTRQVLVALGTWGLGMAVTACFLALPGPAQVGGILGAVSFLGSGLGCILLLIRSESVLKKLGFCCHRCDKVFEPRLLGWMIATRRCPECYSRIVADERVELPPPGAVESS